jgi:hypothetical protein
VVTTDGEWVLGEESTISLKTSRVGLLSIHAKAPVVDGQVRIADGQVEMTFVVAIDQVNTGNPLLDPEVHALVRSGSDGKLTFSGAGSALQELNGRASAGNITVPLELSATPGDAHQEGWHISGQTSFQDIRLPLPGLGHIKHIDVDITGLLSLVQRTASS